MLTVDGCRSHTGKIKNLGGLKISGQEFSVPKNLTETEWMANRKIFGMFSATFLDDQKLSLNVFVSIKFSAHLKTCNFRCEYLTFEASFDL